MLDLYAPISILLIISTVMSLLIVSLSWLMGPKRPTHRKLEPYESGHGADRPGSAPDARQILPGRCIVYFVRY